MSTVITLPLDDPDGDVLDRLPISDRVYHDLRHTRPLVDALDRHITTHAARHVLLVASNITLPLRLREAGCEVALWQVPDTILIDSLSPAVARTAPLDDLLDPGWSSSGGRFDVIVLPFVLESVRRHPAAVLEGLRRLLVPGGRIVVAHRRLGGLEARLRGAAGRPVLRDPDQDGVELSFSWPPLPRLRSFDERELAAWCARAGFRVTGQERVIDCLAALPIRALTVTQWIGAELGQAARIAVPALRDCSIVELAPLPDAMVDRPPDPTVSVAVLATGRGRLDRTLAALAEQVYPRDRFEVLVQGRHDGLAPNDLVVRALEGSETSGAADANRMLREARGALVAFTDDLSLPADGWLDAVVDALAGGRAAVSGRVTADPASATPFLTLPGARPEAGEGGWFSACNSGYVRAAALDSGGFEVGGSGAGVSGWENSLARRLRERGFRVVHEPALQMRRHFPFPSPGRGSRRGWMSEELTRAFWLPQEARRDASVRAGLHRGLFASRRTMFFDLAVAGVVLGVARRKPALALLAIPWVVSAREYVPYWPPRKWDTAARNLRGMTVRHLIWLSGLAAGSLRARRVVL